MPNPNKIDDKKDDSKINWIRRMSMRGDCDDSYIVINILCSPHGGIATYVLGLIQALEHNCIEQAIAYNYWKSDENFSRYVSASKGLERRRLRIHTHKLPVLGTLKDIYSVVNLAFTLSKRGKKLYLAAHGTSAAGIAVIASLFIGNTRVIYIPHGGLSHLYNSKKKYLHIFAHLYDGLLALMRTILICESKYTHDLYRDTYKYDSLFSLKPKGYIYSLTNVHREKYELNRLENSSRSAGVSNEVVTKPLRVAYIGTWRAIKGAIHLANIVLNMESSHSCLPNGREISYEFYTDLKVDMKYLTAKNRVNVSFYGWCPDVMSLLNGIDIQVIPSMGEAFGYAAVEALLSEVKIIHTGAGGLREILQATNMPILPIGFTSDQLYEAVCKISSLSFNELLVDKEPLKHIYSHSYWGTDAF